MNYEVVVRHLNGFLLVEKSASDKSPQNDLDADIFVDAISNIFRRKRCSSLFQQSQFSALVLAYTALNIICVGDIITIIWRVGWSACMESTCVFLEKNFSSNNCDLKYRQNLNPKRVQSADREMQTLFKPFKMQGITDHFEGVHFVWLIHDALEASFWTDFPVKSLGSQTLAQKLQHSDSPTKIYGQRSCLCFRKSTLLTISSELSIKY